MAQVSDTFTGVQLEVVGKALAIAVQESRKFNNAEHKTAMDYIIKNSDPKSLAENLARIGNISQVSQELTKAGVIAGTTTALANQVKIELSKSS